LGGRGVFLGDFGAIDKQDGEATIAFGSAASERIWPGVLVYCEPVKVGQSGSDKKLNSSDKTICESPRCMLLGYRLGAGLVGLVCLSVLVIAGYVEPDAEGVGTHEQLGLHACGFYERTGYPCPTCGMTTAFAHVVRGHIAKAFGVQPAGALGALVCVMVTIVAVIGVVSPKRLDKFMVVLLFNTNRIVLCVAGVILASWLWLCLLRWLRNN